MSTRKRAATKVRTLTAYPPEQASQPGINQLGPATLDAFLPLIVALTALLLGTDVSLRAIEIAAGAGALIALYRLWTYMPWTQRKYSRQHNTH